MSAKCAMFLERSSRTEDGQTAIDIRAVAAVPPIMRQPRGCRDRLTTTRSCARRASRRGSTRATRDNALPQLARAVVNCRILPGLPGAEVETVLRRLAGDKVKVTVLEPPMPARRRAHTGAVNTIEQLVARHWPTSGDSDDGGRRDRRDVPREAPAFPRTVCPRSTKILTTCARMARTNALASSRSTERRSSGSIS